MDGLTTVDLAPGGYAEAVPSHQDQAHQALARWAGFPVRREPRPIVFTSMSAAQLDQLAEDARFRAMFDGPAVAESELPAELIPAATAYCRDVHTGASGSLAPVIRGPGPFATDRGVRDLPAWMMYPANRRWPFIAVDPEFERQMTWRPHGLVPSGGEESSLAGDGRTLTYRFIGTPKVYAAYPHAEVYETDTAVFVQPMEVPLDGGDGVRLAYMERREVVVRLAAPLGNRVLISRGHGPGADTFGAPLTVLPSGS
ncbi:hypothetical protein [Phytohabitans aurantiacus]|uniref:DUF2169 domain-containing protein n=1 Tax=Phytohabitans aurantiacus TaxID=3016789 RepID=A0ABQ5R6D7_9ACTN|nr:hypothetical protein [Phytohabitans aurantiacus]GLI01773.1 hypothetical protein Pa4123_70490 [Phytohabitans aurantiacus]